nr:hypothetical protein GCM10017745_52280 [Saccharothrix mutabilis subsp. capreolus]
MLANFHEVINGVQGLWKVLGAGMDRAQAALTALTGRRLPHPIRSLSGPHNRRNSHPRTARPHPTNRPWFRRNWWRSYSGNCLHPSRA